MASYKLVRVHPLIFANRQRLEFEFFKIEITSNSDVEAHNKWYGMVQELNASIFCVPLNRACVPDVSNKIVELEGETGLLTERLEQFYSSPEIGVTFSSIRWRSDSAHLFWFVNNTVRGSKLVTDRKELYGQSLYCAKQRIPVDSPLVEHIHMDETGNVHDQLLGNKQYCIQQGHDCEIWVTV